ncbi:hypothetical protein BDZ45DRAFT_391697 [Acephala macrosclerotiorum]|nr:hypothetical protein BDZ45DRAFT_391697 [Acephala macrosclerotiorum]
MLVNFILRLLYIYHPHLTLMTLLFSSMYPLFLPLYTPPLQSLTSPLSSFFYASIRVECIFKPKPKCNNTTPEPKKHTQKIFKKQ